MSNDNTPFPAGAKRFFLRGDFPEEFCFPELVCSPARRPLILEAARLGRPLPNPFPDDGYVDLSSHERARFYAYDSVGCKGSTIYQASISDGLTWMPVPKAGLFDAMLKEASRAYGKPIEPLLFPKPPTRPFEDWMGINYSILHDTVSESAAFLPWEVVNSYLKLRPAKP